MKANFEESVILIEALSIASVSVKSKLEEAEIDGMHSCATLYKEWLDIVEEARKILVNREIG